MGATCVPEAKQGEPGYCGKGQNMSPSDDNKEIFEVKPDSTNWGFCDPKCGIRKAKMILISSEECFELQDNKMKYLPDKELCAGHKVYRRIDAYKYYKNYKRPRSNRR